MPFSVNHLLKFCTLFNLHSLAKIAVSPPTLVLLDVMMPGMNGFEVTRCIRQQPSLQQMPVVLVTAHAEVNLRQGLALGANDFICKPIDCEQLLAKIHALTINA